jgi:hypothetical protein
MKWSRIVIFLALALGAWGCQSTPYQRAGATSGHGYSDRRLSEDTFHVAFSANYTTSDSLLYRYLLRRAVELTLRHGFRYFAIIREPRPLTEYQIKYRCQEDEEAGIDGKEVEMPAWGTLHMTIQCFKDLQGTGTSGVRLMDAAAYLHKNLGLKPK